MPKGTFTNLPPEKRALVEEAAIEEFAQRGFEAASISQIVASAGIAKGSFYQYFHGKQDLFLHLVERAAQEKAAFFQQHQPPGPLNLDFFAYLRWMFEVGYQYAAVQSRLNQAVSRVLFGEGLYLGGLFREVRAASAAAFTGMIRQAVEQGHIDPQVDPAAAAFIIETILNALGTHLLEKTAQEKLQEGSLDWLTSDAARQEVNQVLYILESGMKKKGDCSAAGAIL